MHGYIQSIESFATLDGPGLRSVVFMQGCPLSCKYCHNADCKPYGKGRKLTPKELFEELMQYSSYWSKDGGVTISGGEPTAQFQFVSELTDLLKEKGIHIAIDSSLATAPKVIDELLPKVDLWMCSLKHMDDTAHKQLIGSTNKHILKNFEYLDRGLVKFGKKKSLRVRFVVIPSLTDSKEHITKLANFIGKLESLEKVELLGYTDIGKDKWKALTGKYDLEHIPPATSQDVMKVKKVFDENQIAVLF